MGELGTWLKETRETQALSPEEVEAQTRIRRTFLQALEEGNYDVLPGEVFVRGFLRNYALYLGLSPEEVHHQYDQELLSHGVKKYAEGESGFQPINAALEPPRWPIRTLVLRVFFVLVLLVGIAGAIVWYWYGSPLPRLPVWWPLRISMLPPVTIPYRSTIASLPAAVTVGPISPTVVGVPTAVVPTITPKPRVLATSAVLPLPIPTLVPSATPTHTPAPLLILPEVQKLRGLRLEVRVIERAWMQITTDGEVSLERILEVGEERVFQAEYSISLRCGNAGGVLITVNGEELGTLGERGQVVETSWVAQEEPGTTVIPSSP